MQHSRVHTKILHIPYIVPRRNEKIVGAGSKSDPQNGVSDRVLFGTQRIRTHSCSELQSKLAEYNNQKVHEFLFEGHQFTWERSRGMDNMIAEKLDRIFTSESWLSSFDGATATSMVCPYSDHLPLILTPGTIARRNTRKRFCFDNAIWRWGKTYNKEFQRSIDSCRRRMDQLRGRRDGEAKELCYKAGDVNNKFFHNSVKVRKLRNRIHRLRNSAGAWVEDDAALGEVMVEYFNTLFQ
nr:uncharacterized protein LOC109158536 [Ipomoea batatas]